jgi:hypothetical protein
MLVRYRRELRVYVWGRRSSPPHGCLAPLQHFPRYRKGSVILVWSQLFEELPEQLLPFSISKAGILDHDLKGRLARSRYGCLSLNCRLIPRALATPACLFSGCHLFTKCPLFSRSKF